MFSLVNLAVAQAVLRNRNVDPGTVNRDSVIAALLPGVIGLAVPLIVANNTSPQQSTQSNGGTNTTVIKVPDATTGNPAIAEADRLITDAQLVPVHEFAFDENIQQGQVLDQDPEAGGYVFPQTQVTLIVSNGPQPAGQAVHPALAGFDLAVLQKFAQEQQEFVQKQQRFAREQLEAHEDKLSKAMEDKIQASEQRILQHIERLQQANRRPGGNPLPP